jgi:RND family efflux transporter MFP subunit
MVAASVMGVAAIVGAYLVGRLSHMEAVAQRAPAVTAAPESSPSAKTEASGVSQRRFVGVVLASKTAEIAARFQGRLTEVPVRIGDRVRAGAILAVLDVPVLRHELRAAEASLRTSEVEQARGAVELTEAEERLVRYTGLFADGASSGEELTSAKYQRQLGAARLRLMESQVAERRTLVERLRRENEEATVRAPFDGVVAARYVDQGAMIGLATPIVRLISAGELIVRFAVPEADAKLVSIGMSIEVALPDAPLPVRATIAKIAPEIDAASRMVYVEATLAASAQQEPLAMSGGVARITLLE